MVWLVYLCDGDSPFLILAGHNSFIWNSFSLYSTSFPYVPKNAYDTLRCDTISQAFLIAFTIYFCILRFDMGARRKWINRENARTRQNFSNKVIWHGEVVMLVVFVCPSDNRKWETENVFKSNRRYKSLGLRRSH